MATAMAVFAPAVLVAALLARPDEPLQAPLPDIGGGEPVGEPKPGARVERVGDLVIVLRDCRGDESPRRTIVEIEPFLAPAQADVLVYWLSDADALSTLPRGARLVGALAGTAPRRLAMPDGVGPADGALAFYSLATQRLLGPPMALDQCGPAT